MKQVIVGLTGGIASGKTVATRIFEELGAYIVDTDVISKQLSDTPEVGSEMKKEFGECFVGDTLDRRKLREVVFADEARRQTLNSIIHPRIKKETLRQISSSDARVVVAVVPLLFESGFDELVNITVAIACDERERTQRLIRRDGIDGSLAVLMVKAQMSESERNSRADIVISNDGGIEELRAKIKKVYEELEGGR